MNKILLSVIVASSFAMSGDLAKCTEAIEMQIKYLNKGKEERKDKYEVSKMMRKAKGEVKEVLQESVQACESMIRLYSTLRSEWKKVAQKECRGIVHDDTFGFAEGKQE